MNTNTIALLTLALATACGPNAALTEQTGEDSGAAPVADAGPGIAPPASGIQLHTEPYTLAPGDESVVCQVLDPAHAALLLSAYEVSERFGVHHLTLYYGAPGVKDPCASSMQPVFLAQQRHVRTELSGGAPEYQGATLAIPAGTFVAKIHAVNTTDAPVTIEAWLNLETSETTTVPLSFLSLTAGATTLAVPAHTAQTFSASVSAPADVTIVQLAGHTHSHTTEQRASYGGKRVYVSDVWEEPATAWFNSTTAPLVVRKATPLSWECDINNTTDATLRVAERVDTAEMCNLTGFVRGAAGWAAAMP